VLHPHLRWHSSGHRGGAGTPCWSAVADWFIAHANGGRASTVEGLPAVAIHRLDQRPDLIGRIYEVDSAWPEFMAKDPVANALYWQVAGAFPHLCALAVDEHGAVAATARALAFALEAEGRRELPDGGLDRVTVWAFNDRAEGRVPDTASAVEIALGRAHRGSGLSHRMLAAMRDAARAAGLTRLIAPVRPTGKHRYPAMPMTRYIAMRRGDGLPDDPWLRGAHQGRGAHPAGRASLDGDGRLARPVANLDRAVVRPHRRGDRAAGARAGPLRH